MKGILKSLEEIEKEFEINEAGDIVTETGEFSLNLYKQAYTDSKSVKYEYLVEVSPTFSYFIPLETIAEVKNTTPISIKLKTWEELEQEFGFDKYGNIVINKDTVFCRDVYDKIYSENSIIVTREPVFFDERLQLTWIIPTEFIKKVIEE